MQWVSDTRPLHQPTALLIVDQRLRFRNFIRMTLHR